MNAFHLRQANHRSGLVGSLKEMKLATFNARAESVDNRRRLQAQAVSHSQPRPTSSRSP